ncbi:MAG: hypothetical protein MI867_17285 [Pseudomonadales bacterium]|nr:hypothetical protein [Pseudomonadales bacterium]
MNSHSYLQVPNKIRTLLILAIVASFLIMLALGIPVLAHFMNSGVVEMSYIMGIHFGVYVISLWVSYEAQSIDSQIELYMFTKPQESKAANYLSIIFIAPSVAAVASLLSFILMV